jgi:hypothetical protein
MDERGKQRLNFQVTPLQLAQKEWECETTPHPKQHFYENGKKQKGLHEFRKCCQAIALINWNGDEIEITKLEKLPGAGQGAAIPLVNFLKALADKHHIRLWGQAKTYTPDPPRPEGPFPTQEQLEAWYKRLGFQLFTRGKTAPTWIWYPDIPPDYTNDDAGSLPAG